MKYSINTSDTNITFTVNGKVKTVPKNRVWVHYNTDTVTFLLIERYDTEGICLLTTKAEDLEINGTTYTYQQLLDGEGISDLFSPMGLSYEVVEELPETGEEGIIYLLPNEDDTYTEYIWVSDIQDFEIIGTTDVDLANYYTKTQSDNTFATQTVVNQEIAARIQGDSDINTALATKASLNYVDTALAAKVDQTDFDEKEEVISTALNDLDENKQDKLTAGANITIDANNVISSTGGTQVQADWTESDTTDPSYIQHKPTLATVATSGDYNDLTNKPTIPDTSDFVTKAEYNPKEVAIANALTQLNENKADKSEIPVVPDMTNYYTKTETDNTFVSQADFDVKEEVISAGLNTLNTSKADASSVYTKTEIDAMIGNINTILASI